MGLHELLPAAVQRERTNWQACPTPGTGWFRGARNKFIPKADAFLRYMGAGEERTGSWDNGALTNSEADAN